MVPYWECASAKPNPSSVKCELFGQLYSSLHRVCSGSQLDSNRQQRRVPATCSQSQRHLFGMLGGSVLL